MGAKNVITTCSGAHSDFVRSLGADQVCHKSGHFQFLSNVLVPDWALGRVQMHRDHQESLGIRSKSVFGRVLIEQFALLIHFSGL